MRRAVICLLTSFLFVTRCARFCNVCFCYDSNNLFYPLFSVRATSVLCLLGLGLGLSSLLVYRFCTRLFSSSRTKTSSSRNSKGHKTIAKSNGIKAAASSCNSRASCLPVSATACNSGSDSEKTSPEVCFLLVHCMCIYREGVHQTRICGRIPLIKFGYLRHKQQLKGFARFQRSKI